MRLSKMVAILICRLCGHIKWIELLQYSRETGIPAIVLFGFDDGVLAYTQISDLTPQHHICMSGRLSAKAQRGDKQDIEPCVRVYRNMLKRVPLLIGDGRANE